MSEYVVICRDERGQKFYVRTADKPIRWTFAKTQYRDRAQRWSTPFDGMRDCKNIGLHHNGERDVPSAKAVALRDAPLMIPKGGA